jgi:hypothetical protein
MTNLLEQIVKESISLEPPNARGWCGVLCKVCNDAGHKGPRAAFIFTGFKTSYHCFNCGKKSVFDPSAGKMSNNMVGILTAFGVPFSLITKASNEYFFNTPLTATEILEDQRERSKIAHPTPITLPDEFEFISPANPDHQDAIDYLTPRCVDYQKYGLMVSSTTNPKNKWYKRIIVPMYNRTNQIIFYQGRTYTNHKMRWESPTDPKSNVLFGYHNLDDYDKDYIIVCEGTFDAMCIDGVAILGSSFTPFHLNTLNLSRKKKIVVPQRDKRGYAMALQALEHGYSLSFPDIGRASDINDAVIQYGRLYTERQIVSKATTSKYEAQLKLGLWCSN